MKYPCPIYNIRWYVRVLNTMSDEISVSHIQCHVICPCSKYNVRGLAIFHRWYARICDYSDKTHNFSWQRAYTPFSRIQATYSRLQEPRLTCQVSLISAGRKQHSALDNACTLYSKHITTDYVVGSVGLCRETTTKHKLLNSSLPRHKSFFFSLKAWEWSPRVLQSLFSEHRSLAPSAEIN